MFIQTEQTPNPATLKFLPGRDVVSKGVVDFTDPEQAQESPLARRVFAVEGVTGGVSRRRLRHRDQGRGRGLVRAQAGGARRDHGAFPVRRSR